MSWFTSLLRISSVGEDEKMKQSERILKLRETDANDSEDNDDGVIIKIEMQSVIPIFTI